MPDMIPLTDHREYPPDEMRRREADFLAEVLIVEAADGERSG